MTTLAMVIATVLLLAGGRVLVARWTAVGRRRRADWAAFERDFWEYVERRQARRSRWWT
jgi:hypothetical protein